MKFWCTYVVSPVLMLAVKGLTYHLSIIKWIHPASIKPASLQVPSETPWDDWYLWQVVEAAAREGAKLVEQWFVGSGASHVVCEGTSVQRYLGHSSNIITVSPCCIAFYIYVNEYFIYLVLWRMDIIYVIKFPDSLTVGMSHCTKFWLSSSSCILTFVPLMTLSAIWIILIYLIEIRECSM